MRQTELAYGKQKSHFVASALGVVFFTALLCFSSLVKIPLFFTPVPVTFQNLVAILAGAALGPLLGPLAVGLYIAVGFLGVPLFANAGAGLLYLLGPTSGYLFGFMCAAWLAGHLLRSEEKKSFFFTSAAVFLCFSVIYLAGGLWLKMGYAWDFKKIFTLGVAPFFVPDMMKAVAVVAMLRKSR